MQLPNDSDEGILRDAALRTEADKILESGLARILSGYGKVHVDGSYALHLMTWRDLDIYVVRAELDRDVFFHVGANISLLLKPTKMSFRDETIAKTPGLPLGLYWGVYLGDERKNAWKIDVWAIQPPVYEEFQILKEHLLSRLVPETRTAIMRIKSVVWRHPEYRRAFSSQDVYSAVLDSGIADVNGFWEYLRSKGVLV